MRRKKVIATFLIVLFVLGGTLLPHQEAQAFFHPSSGDALQMMSNAIDSVSDTLTSVVTGIFVALLASSALLFTSAKLLDWAVGIPLALNLTPGTPGYNPLVDSGFDFALGLVNVFILILFVIIAFSSILRLDAFGARKSLPRLILVALLANFSMLLVGFFTDIAQVLFNSTGLAATGNITDSALAVMKSGVKEMVDWFTIFYSAWIAKAIIPFAQIPGTAFIAYQVLHGLNGGALLQALFFVVLNAMLGFIFLLYALLFIARVVIIWFLAIVSPLALAASVLPATKKYWDQWLHALISWSFLGIVAFFLLGLGLNLFSVILKIHGAPDALIQPGGTGDATLSSGFYAYIFLAIYLFVAFQVSRKFTPVGANAFLSAVTGLPGRLAGTRLGAKALAGVASGTQGLLARGQNLAPRNPLAKMAAKPLKWTAGGVNRAVGARMIEYAASKRRPNLPKNFDQMSEPELEAWAKAGNLGDKDLIQLAARMQDKKKYKHTSQAFKDKVNAALEGAAVTPWLQPEVGTLLDVAPETVTKEISVKTIMATEGKTKEEAKEKVQASIDNVVREIQAEAAASKELQAEIQRDWIGKGKTVEDLAAAKIYAQELKPQDIPNVINPKTLAFRLAMRDSNPASLQRLQDNFDHATLENMFTGAGGLNDAANTSEKLNALYEKNPRLVKNMFTNPALQGLAWTGRDNMRDASGQITRNFAGYEAGMRTREMISRSGDLKDLFLSVQKNAEQRQGLMKDIEAAEYAVRQAGALVTQQLKDELENSKDALKDTNEVIESFIESIRKETNPLKKAQMQEFQQTLNLKLQNLPQNPSTGPQTGSRGRRRRQPPQP